MTYREEELDTRKSFYGFKNAAKMTTLTFIALAIFAFEIATAQTKSKPQPKSPATKAAAPEKVGVLVGEIKETRTTGQFFAGMEVELKLMGDVLADAKGLRVSIEKAIDDTGRNLINEKKQEAELKEVDPEKNAVEAEIKLLNPVRQATAIQELSGTVEIFIPARDPDSITTITNFASRTNAPISPPGMKAAGVEVTIWTKEQFDARKKVEEERLKKEVEAQRKKAEDAKSDEERDESIMEGLTKIFGGMFNSFAQMEESSVAFQITDPDSRLVSIDFEDERGKPVSHNGVMTMGGGKTKTRIYDFSSKLPAGSRIRLSVLTPRSTIKVPFKLSNVPLP